MNKPNLVWSIVIICSVGISQSLVAGGKTQRLEGTWIGYAFLSNGTNLPIRFDIRTGAHKIEATFDSVTDKRYGLSVTGAEWNPPAVRLSWAAPGGVQISLQGKLAATSIRGSLRWGTESGTFELIRSPQLIADIDPLTYADVEGIYERAPGDIVEIYAKPWGEMRYLERKTGQLRTLFPTTADKFFIGSAVYNPAPIEARIQIIRHHSGRLRDVVETRSNGINRRLRRLVIREEAIGFRNGETVLKGTLMIPSHSVPLPAIVILGGSGWETRTDVRSRAVALASLGFVTLSYDHRGFGESGGEQEVRFATDAGDALAAVSVLRKRKEVDSHAVGIFGESRGGWTAPLAASLSRDVKFLILLVPPSVSPAEQETSSRLDQMRSAGFNQADLDLASKLIAAAWRWMRNGDNWAQYLNLRSEAVGRKLPNYVFESEKKDAPSWKWGRLNMFFEPCSALSSVTVPVLAIFGGSDLYVSAAINRPRLLQCLSSTARRQATIHTVAGATHDLTVPSSLPVNRINETGDRSFPLMADWALKKFPVLRKDH